MRKLFCTLIASFFLFSQTCFGATEIQEAGVSKGYVNVLNFNTGATITKAGITGTVDIAAGGSPGGFTTQIQYNDEGAFGGHAGMTFNDAVTEEYPTFQGSPTANGGVGVGIRIAPDFTGLTNTAGYDALQINPSVDGSGSGTENLINAMLANTVHFSVSKTGDVLLSDSDIPTITITDTTDGDSAYLSRTDASAQFTISNTVEQVGGDGYALLFDGSTAEYVTIADSGALDIGTGVLTLSCWIKVATLGQDTYIIGAVPQDEIAFQYYGVDGSLWAYYGSGGTYAWTAALAINDNNWHHVVMLRTGAAMQIWLDGANATAGSTGSQTTDITLTSLLIGKQSAGFPGTVSDVAIWSKVLTSTDIIDIYNAGTGLSVINGNNFPTSGTPMATNLIGLWKLNEGSGVDAEDASASGQDGTLTGMEAEDWVTGIFPLAGTEPTCAILKSIDGAAPYEAGITTLTSYDSVGGGYGGIVIDGQTVKIKKEGVTKFDLTDTGLQLFSDIVTVDTLTDVGIDDAINLLGVSGGALFLKPGTYSITGHMSIDADGTMIQGMSGYLNSSTYSTLDILDFANSYVYLRDIRFYGKSGGGGGGSLLYGTAAQSNFFNLNIQSSDNMGIYFTGLTQSFVVDNYFYGNDSNALYALDGSVHNIISENIFESNLEDGIDYDGDHSIISNNVLVGTTGNAIELTGNADHNIIIGNNFDNNGTNAVDGGTYNAWWNATNGNWWYMPYKVTVSAGAGKATLTLTPQSNYIEITQNDADGCDVTMGETGIVEGVRITITNLSANTCDFADTAGVTELAGAFTMGQYDTLELMYIGDRWIETSRSNN